MAIIDSRSREYTRENHLLCLGLSMLTLGIIRFFSVPQGWVRLVMAFGKVRRVASAGLNYCVSFWGLYQRPSKAVPTQEQVDEYSEPDVLSSDGVQCHLDLVVFYRIVDPVRAMFDIEDPWRAVEATVKANLRDVCGSMPARTLLASRDAVAARIKERLGPVTGPWGVEVRLVEIKGLKVKTQS